MNVLHLIKNNFELKHEVLKTLNYMLTTPDFFTNRDKKQTKEEALEQFEEENEDFDGIYKLCSVCYDFIPLVDKFWSRGETADGYRNKCKFCQAELQRIYNKRYVYKTKKYSLRRKYKREKDGSWWDKYKAKRKEWKLKI